MKIAVLSPSKKHLQDIGAILQGSHDLVLVEGGKSRMRTVAEQDRPDLIVADGMCCDPTELAQVEYVTTHHPSTAVILMCSAHTPEFLLHSMRAGVREVLPSPVSADALGAAVQRVAMKLAGTQTRTPGKVLAFLSCKGGSGATFIAANLAYELAQDKSVLLMDLNLQFGDALSLLHDGKPPATLANVATNIARLDATFLAASTVKITPTLSVLAAPDDPAHAMEVKPEQVDAILSLAVNHYDYVVLDMDRSLDTLSIKALDRAHRIYPVLQSSLPAVRHAHQLMEVFRSLGYPPDKVEPIVNRFDRTSEIELPSILRSLRVDRAHTVGNAYREVIASINHGEPLVKSARNNAVARQLVELALILNPKQEEQRSLLGRLFRRA